jgi:tRNA threonylcarbamoyladenosine biosynthesis protein TsaE
MNSTVAVSVAMANNVNLVIVDLKATGQLSRAIAKILPSIKVLILEGDLGTGKTTLTKLILKELGYSLDVTSPSFSIQNIYKCKSLQVLHYDYYRISQDNLIIAEMLSELRTDNTVAIIEWPPEELLVHLNHLKLNFLKITITYLNDNQRSYSFSSNQASILKAISI